MHVSLNIVGMEENRDDIDLVVGRSMVQLLPTFLCKLLCHWRDIWLILRLVGGSFVGILTLTLFLMQPVQSEQLEMIHHLLSLT